MASRTRSTAVPKKPSLQRFTLEELAPFTKEGVFASNASQDFHLFYVGRDDVHGILRYLLARATTSLARRRRSTSTWLATMTRN